MKKIEVLGISMQDLTLRESMKMVEQFFKKGRVCTIALITMKGLMVAQEVLQIREWMDSLDMTVPADADILHAANIHYRSRIRDVEEDAFIAEFLKKLVRQQRKIYLLGQSEAGLKKLEEELSQVQSGLQIIGRFSLDNLEHDEDYIINDINLKAPEVLISNLSSPNRESFLANNHMKLNVAIWLMVRSDRELCKRNHNLMRKFYHKLMTKWFHIRLDRYQEELEQEQSENEG